MTENQYECRYYENQFPDIDELVRVRILHREDHGFRCVLLEYDNVEGLVLLNELKRGRVRSYHKILKKNKDYTVLVLRVHQNEGPDGKISGFIDLSLKAVPRDQLPLARDRWEKGKTVHGILRHVARQANISTMSIYESFGWPLAKEYGHIYLGLKKIMNSEAQLKETEPEAKKAVICADLLAAGVPENALEFFYNELSKRMKPVPETVRAAISMKCLSVHAVSGIQDALAVGLQESTEDFPLILRIVASPIFQIACTSMEPEEAKERINAVIEKMKVVLESKGGIFRVTEPPVIERYVEMLERELQDIGGGEEEDLESKND